MLDLKEKNKIKKKLLIVDRFPSSFTYKLLFYLRDYLEITYIMLEKNSELEEYKKLGIKTYSFDRKGIKSVEALKFFFRILLERTNSYDFVLAKTAPNWIGYILFKIFGRSKKIYLPYDIHFFLYKNNKDRSKLEFLFERYNFKHADFIVHKGFEEELNLIKKEEVSEIKGKSIQILPSCFSKWVCPIKPQKDKLKGLNLVFIGSSPTYHPFFDIQFPDFFKSISEQGIDLHIYSTTDDVEEIKEKNIHMHKPLSNLELNQELGKYQYGVCQSTLSRDSVDPRWFKTTMGNKIFSYFEAGLPVIVDEETEFMVEIVKKYNCGIVILNRDWKNLRKLLKKQDYLQLLGGVERVRQDLNIEKQVKIFIEELGIKKNYKE